MSRIKFYLRAIIDYSQRHLVSRITKKLNEIYVEEVSSLDSVFFNFQMASLDKESWQLKKSISGK
jgi:hypothetical protein